MAGYSTLFSFLIVISCCICANNAAPGNKLIVVLIDGCKWDYIDDPKLELKGIKKIIENGVRAPYVNPAYPSLSYVNWYSIVTGLHPENHGFINNIMYDNKTGSSFLMFPKAGSTDPHWWNGAEPIWVTAEKLGKNTAMYWWVGCEVEIMGKKPMICERHRYGPGTDEEKLDFLERIDDVVEMFKPPHKDRLSLALMYYGPVDYTGHEDGPGTAETRRALKDIDEVLYKMQKKIAQAGLQDEVNIMVVSDHGMTDTRDSVVKYIDLERFQNNIKYQVAAGAQSMLVPVDGMLDKLYKHLKEANIEGIKVFKKEEIPESYHLKRGKLMNDIFIQAEKGFYIKALKNSHKRIGYESTYKGSHGYHPDDVNDMRTIFLATGPGFQKGHTLPPINNTDLYNIMCYVLQIDPLPNNGSSELLKEIKPENNSHLTSKASCVTRCIFLPLFTFILYFVIQKINI